MYFLGMAVPERASMSGALLVGVSVSPDGAGAASAMHERIVKVVASERRIVSTSLCYTETFRVAKRCGIVVAVFLPLLSSS